VGCKLFYKPIIWKGQDFCRFNVSLRAIRAWRAAIILNKALLSSSNRRVEWNTTKPAFRVTIFSQNLTWLLIIFTKLSHCYWSWKSFSCLKARFSKAKSNIGVNYNYTLRRRQEWCSVSCPMQIPSWLNWGALMCCQLFLFLKAITSPCFSVWTHSLKRKRTGKYWGCDSCLRKCWKLFQIAGIFSPVLSCMENAPRAKHVQADTVTEKLITWSLISFSAHC